MLGNEMLSRSPGDLETEADAYAFLESLRWGSDGPTECPHCASDKGAWYLKPKDPEGRRSKGGSAARSQRRVWKCRENTCRRQFSVLTNTVLRATKMPVRAWVGAIIDLCEDPSGVSARDIAARWAITEKSAWAMLSRIEDALGAPEVAGAHLHINAPLWFELAPEGAAAFEEEKHDQRDAAAAARAEQDHADRTTTERIDRDVQRAMTDLLEHSDASERTATQRPMTPASEGTLTLTPAPDDDDSMGAEGLPSGAVSRAADQQPEQGDKAFSGHTADSVSRSTFVIPEGDSRTVPGAIELGAAPKGQHVAEPKRPETAPTAGGSTNSQPVDNSHTSGIGAGEQRPARTPDNTSRAQARRARSRSKNRPLSGADLLADSLGGGWLDEPPLTPAESAPRVSPEPRQFSGIDKSALGPAWASAEGDLSRETQQAMGASDDQMGLFVEPDEDAE